jgi:hypothetical protein
MSLCRVCRFSCLCTVIGVLVASIPLAAQMTVSNTGSTGSSGFNATEGTAISSSGGSSGTDSMWADSSIHRWVMSNHGNANVLVSAWPCSSQGCIPMSGPVSATYYPETPLAFPSGGPGLPLISGALTSGAGYPQWGGGVGGGSNQVYALDLQTGTTSALALASEVANDTSIGTYANQLAVIASTGAQWVGSSSVTFSSSTPYYIVVTRHPVRTSRVTHNWHLMGRHSARWTARSPLLKAYT